MKAYSLDLRQKIIDVYEQAIALKGIVASVSLKLNIQLVGGRSFFYDFSHFNSECLGIYLEEFAQEYFQEIHIIQLDNAPCHTAKKIVNT